MKCPECGAATAVKESRWQANLGHTRRRRQCTSAACNNAFSTREVILVEDGNTERDERIVARVRAGEKQWMLAEEFGISHQRVSDICRAAGVRYYRSRK